MTEQRTSIILCTCAKTLNLDYEFLLSECKKLGSVNSVELHDTLCQPDGLDLIQNLSEQDGQIVIAACTSQKIKPRIDRHLHEKGLDASLTHYVNIREHSAWVHDDVKRASRKALDMIRGTNALASLAKRIDYESKEIPAHVTVIGGGIAGIEATLCLSKLGYSVTLVESAANLGGHVLKLPVVAPTGKPGKEILEPKLEKIERSDSIEVMTNIDVKFVEGELGAFRVHYEKSGGEKGAIATSAVVLAMGFKEFKPFEMEEYRYGRNPDVLTQFELSEMMTANRLSKPSNGDPIREVVMVQCVGSRTEDYKKDCSKLCCTFAIDNAIEILKREPRARVRIVYMDIRVPFENELIYKESREMGVDYIRGRVGQVWEEDNKTIVRIYDSLLNKYLDVSADLVVLSSAVLPANGLNQLSETLGFVTEDDGHVKDLYGKLRRTETRRRGVVAVGAITRPQFVFESVTDAQAAALILHNELQEGKVKALARGAVLDVDECVGCSLCAQQCPRGVPLMIEMTDEEELDEEEKFIFKASIDTMNCHACGVCQSLCPSAATQLNFLTNEQLWAQIENTLLDAGPEEPITVCFHCEECAVSTIDIVGAKKSKYSENTRLIPVPCAGRVSIIDILKCFENGASTVMIASCETDRCHMGGTGNEIAQVQVDVARDILNAIGWHGERVDMFRMFSAEPNRFIDAIEEMVRRAQELGPTPVHQGTAGKWVEVIE